ncbi:Ig domain-containing protein [uncultured Paludibaculum sp.]|uniref:beta strand repeat-containing protein n=1 Tax=uncultured Paludibaculum sp. TaxID=1765020 RepID=UPI002AAAE4AD|nr:Ig domain-containing protein [uncultured Paludibaculum sp.]
MVTKKIFLALLLLLAAVTPSFAASAVYTFTGVASDGRTLSFQYTAPALVTSSTVVAASQASCSPACEDIGLFPNAQLNYDLVVVDVRNPGLSPTAFTFYFPSGSFGTVGAYRTNSTAGSATTGLLTVQTVGAPFVTTTALPRGSVGVPYSTTITGQGGSGSLGYSLASGSLPAGLALNASGVLSGTPTTSGTSQFAIRVTDAAQASSTRSFSLVVAQGLAITSLSPLTGGTVGLPYVVNLTASGGSPSYSWTLESGSLPPGLSLSPSGALSGTPFAGGTFTFTVRATDTASATATQVFAISISSLLTITTNSTLPGGAVGSSYTAPLAVVGGAAPHTWTIISGQLPAGLSLSSAGLISGTPTASGLSNFTVKVQDAGLNLATQSFTLTIGLGLTVTTVSPLPTGVAGSAYQYTLTAAGGTPAYSWINAGGSLPAGLSLSQLGVISGTPTTPGASTFFARVVDATATPATLPLSISILPALQITTPSALPAATPGLAYSQILSVSGGSSPYNWSLAGGSMPTGLTLSTTGLLSGTPTTAGTFNFVTRVTDAASGFSLQSFNLSVGSTLAITTSSPLPNAPLNTAYSQTLTVTGGTAPFTFGVVSGSLPTGLSLSTTGVVSGTPTVAGTSTFTVLVMDGGGLTATKELTITTGTAGFNIDSPSILPGGTQGVAYSQALAASGGTAPYSWLVTDGVLPPGLTLSTAGAVTGTPTTVGTYTFSVRATDASSTTTTKSMSITVALSGSGLTITTSSPLPVAPLNQPYSVTMAGSGGTSPYIWTFSGGSIPPGLLLNTNGMISGTPTMAGTYSFSILLTDHAGASVQGVFSLTVGSGLTITSSSTLPSGNVGSAYSQTLGASGGTPPYIFSLQAGTLPSGLQLNTGGLLAGIPLTVGTSTFTVRVQDSTGASVTGSFTVAIGAVVSGLTISPSSLPGGSLGVFYSQTLTASGGTAPYIFSLFSGTLPSGINIASGGNLSGTPISSGSFVFTIRVVDSVGTAALQLYTISIGSTIQINTPSPLPTGSVNVFYSQTLSGGGGTAPYSWSISSGSLPTGMVFSTVGTISGTPTSGGTYVFVVRLADATGASTTQSYTLTINGGVTITTPSPLPDGSVGSSYFLTFGANGGTGPYNWSVVSGAMPPGLSLATSGALTGVPSTQGQYQFVVKILDGAGLSSSAPFTLTINSGTVLPRAGIIAQLATGADWKTTIVLLNPGSSPAQVRVNLMAEDGTPLILPLTVTQSGSSITTTAAVVDRTIPANGLLQIESEAAISTTTVGWADVRSAATLSGYAIFRQRGGDGRDSEGTSPLETKYPTNVLIPYDHTSSFSTGVALVNLDTAGTLTAILRDDSGNEITRDVVSMGANGHISFSLPVRFPILNGRRGTVEFVNNQNTGTVSLGLRFSPTLSFTSVPVTPR